MNQENKERLKAKINGVSTPVGDALSVVIPGHPIKGWVWYDDSEGKYEWCGTVCDGDKCELIIRVRYRGKNFCSRVTRWAMRGVASYVGKHRRLSANKMRKDEAAACANFDVKASLGEAEV